MNTLNALEEEAQPDSPLQGVWVATVNVERADPIQVDLDGLWL